MSVADFLLELRCEEIPARMQAKASADLARLFSEALAGAGLSAASITSYVTPRRLALVAHDLPLATQAVSEEFKGPRTSAPEQALDGFLRKTGLTRDQLEDRDGVWFATVEKPGRATAEVLAEVVPAIVRAFPWPKSMRWGQASRTTESLRWVRPLQGVIALLGGDVVPIEIDGIASGRETMGHRFHSSGAISIESAATYADALRAAYVIVDQVERARIIAERASALAAEAGLVLVEDAGLVAENAGLTEWPVPLLGRFDHTFLEVPPEVIQLTLRINQKYFVLKDAAGKLANAFICTANIEATDGGAAIVAGNGKVLAARLSDARFFWEQDKKTPLAVHAEKLSRITFHEKLGTVADKVARVAKLAEWLASEGIVPNCDPALARQAAELCKADLVTEMVGEFPELQGLMGGYYARVEGLPDQVADAIRDHYKPVGQGDEVPTAPVTMAVSLADKLDTLIGFFRIGEVPTGSRDPFALRRAALGLLGLTQMNGLRVPFNRVLPMHMLSVDTDFARSHGQATMALMDFLADRLKVQQREAGVRHDLIDAVFALGGEDDLVRLLARVKALQAFIETDEGANLLAGYKRAANILKKEGDPEGASGAGYTLEPAEAALIAALDAAEPLATSAIEREDFTAAMAALAGLRAPIDEFFTDVTVNDADPAKRDSRLRLLTRIRAAVHKVADFSKIEG
jgi:glycyl-tRNA synthetase beta chain